MDLLYDDQISFHLKPQLLQLHNWLHLLLSILCLSIVKQPDELQLLHEHGRTLVASIWAIFCYNV